MTTEVNSPVSHPHTWNFKPELPRLQEMGEGIFAYIQPDGGWMLNNTGFVVGADAVTVIDTCGTEPRTKAFIEAIRSVTDKPLRTLINTHFHGDHTYGNSFFLPQATVIAHEKCRRELSPPGWASNRFFQRPIGAKSRLLRLL